LNLFRSIKIFLFLLDVPNDYCPAEQIDVETIQNLIHITPPYTVSQILEIERIKRPVGLDRARRTKECSYCLRPENCNPNGQLDRFLTCADCDGKAHPFCLMYKPGLIEHITSNKLKWQCYECKKCSVCLQTDENLMLCDKCDRGYHKECCVPKLSIMPKGKQFK